MIEKYELHENEWLKVLYEERERWIPFYLKDVFWAGMSSTQRSESMNSFFDGYVHSKTTLKQFVEQYELALSHKVEKETAADVESSSKLISICTQYPMEKQLQGLYTLAKFKEFQKEITSMLYCYIVKEVSDPYSVVTEELLWIDGKSRKNTYDVTFDSIECEVRCSCRMSEFRGILCRHALDVLIRHGVDLIPDKYIVERWRKDVKISHTSFKVNVSSWRNSIEHRRYNDLTIRFSEFADRVAKREDKCNDVKEWLVVKMEELNVEEENARRSNLTGNECDDNGEGEEGNGVGEEASEGIDVLDPVYTKRKGRPKCTRLQAAWKKSHNQSNISMEGDERNDAATSTTKRRGRPRGSKNKKQGVQQSEMSLTQESVLSNTEQQPPQPQVSYMVPQQPQVSYMIQPQQPQVSYMIQPMVFF